MPEVRSQADASQTREAVNVDIQKERKVKGPKPKVM